MKQKKPLSRSKSESSPAAFSWPEVRWPWETLSKEFKLAFIITLAMGFVVHQYALNNLLLGNDSQNGVVTSNSNFSNGRWALGFLSSFSTNYQASVIIGLISIVMIALTAGVTVSLLELSHPAGVAAVSALLITYPVIADTFAYMFTADAYFIALFLNALAVWLVKRFRLGFLAGVFLIGAACGAYQAYIGYAVGLFLFDCVLALLSEENTPAVLRRGLKYIAVLAGGLIFYLVTANLLIRGYGYELPSYQGMDAIAHPDLRALWKALPKAYDVYWDYYETMPSFSRLAGLVHRAVPAFCVVFILFLAAAKKLYKQPVRLLLLAIGICLAPLALNFVTALSYNATVHSLMIYSHVLLYVFFVKLAELAAQRLVASNSRFWKIPALAGLICCCVIAWNNFCATNVCYHALQARYETAYAMAGRTLSKIEELDGYIPGETPVCIHGVPYSPLSVSRFYPKQDIFWRTSFPYMSVSFLNYYCAAGCRAASADQEAAVKESAQLAAMPLFPAKGCAAMIDGVAVVKFSE